VPRTSITNNVSRFHVKLSLPCPGHSEIGVGRQSYLVQRKAWISGDSKVQIQRQVHDILLGVSRRGSGLHLLQAVAQEPDSIDEEAVRGALDLEVSEEGVGAEERDGLVEDVVALAVGVGRLVGRQRRGRDGEGVGRAAGFGAQREEGKVADEAGRVGVVVEDGVVGLEGVVSLMTDVWKARGSGAGVEGGRAGLR
jgi:hypothetical protein